jgi:hypothetical protein
MTVNMSQIRSRAMASSNGQTAKFIRATGLMGSSTAKANCIVEAVTFERESGEMAERSD